VTRDLVLVEVGAYRARLAEAVATSRREAEGYAVNASEPPPSPMRPPSDDWRAGYAAGVHAGLALACRWADDLETRGEAIARIYQGGGRP
jgi:hypothetical protein